MPSRRVAVRISPSSYRPSWAEPSLSLGGDGNTRVWLLDLGGSPPGAARTCIATAFRSGVVGSLSSLLEPAALIPPKYWLSPKACAGILRRASARGKQLPPVLEAALQAVG